MSDKDFIKDCPNNSLSPSCFAENLLSSFQALLNAQIEIGKETDQIKINEILRKYNIPEITVGDVFDE